MCQSLAEGGRRCERGITAVTKTVKGKRAVQRLSETTKLPLAVCESEMKVTLGTLHETNIGLSNSSLLTRAETITEGRLHFSPEGIGVLNGSWAVRAVEKVTHVGVLNFDHRKGMSYEGDGLSVSNNPDDWKRIAKLGGQPEYVVTKNDNTNFIFLEAHDVTVDQWVTIHDWGFSEGLIELDEVHKVLYWDDEEGEVMELWCGSESEARDEAAMYEVPVDGLDADGCGVITEKVWVATPRFTARGNIVAAVSVNDLLLAKWAETTQEHLDGVWWDDVFSEWSAPRGVIFLSKLKGAKCTAPLGVS